MMKMLQLFFKIKAGEKYLQREAIEKFREKIERKFRGRMVAHISIIYIFVADYVVRKCRTFFGCLCRH